MRRSLFITAASLLALTVACGGGDGGTGTPVPTTITVSPGVVSLSALGATQPLTATVRDQNGTVMTGQGITWTSTSTAVATVSPSGVVTAVANGTATVRAAVGAVQGTASVTVAQTVSALVKVSGDAQTAVVGTALPTALVVRANDSRGNPVAGVTVALSVTQGGGTLSTGSQVTGGNGQIAGVTWTLGSSLGPQQVSATAGSATASFAATALATVNISILDGDGQTGLVGFALNVRPAVLVRDAGNNPMAGVPVTFAAATGGGSVTGGSAVSDAAGIARVGNWVLGVAPGGNTLTATVVGAGGSPLTFTATGAAKQYNIDVRFLTAVTAAQKTAFDSAEARWERLIYGDLPDIALNRPSESCATVTMPAITETVDDIIIYARMDSIDGATPPGGSSIVGLASPCNPVRGGTLLIIRGVMRFDTADVAGIIAQGLFDEVVMHEMGHVLGFTPALWNPKGLLVDPSLSGGTDPHFIGAQAIAAFDRSGGASYSAGAKVPIENTGGTSTKDAHWRQTVFATELMTGTLDSGVPNPLSVITTAAMGDLGYTVNYAGSDAYVVANPLALWAGVSSGIRLVEILPPLDEIIEVDRNGRVVRVRHVR